MCVFNTEPEPDISQSICKSKITVIIWLRDTQTNRPIDRPTERLTTRKCSRDQKRNLLILFNSSNRLLLFGVCGVCAVQSRGERNRDVKDQEIGQHTNAVQCTRHTSEFVCHSYLFAFLSFHPISHRTRLR